ncbi:type I-G CRISPR-associated helicase/endonuclease Cas3g [Aquisphaera insulae]|uniref:type I-G CRISPR-associated helicase/endonuclease Cas3g n=1 Tax=Aquisphaera insulae TaxID=2712864 RepID=UPI0013E9F082|nr:type I-U CRISPR-associated helicase/endonuclease Cas3 [Aquisphaera insulae]
MADAGIVGFREYFRALHGEDREPYSWQQRLADLAVEGKWPAAIDLPTGAGKTACLDIAIYALARQAALPAAQRTAPRRIFFCVNRRVVVSEAYDRVWKIARALWDSEAKTGSPVLRSIASALRTVGGTTDERDLPPFDVLELRGGIYLDNRWARSASQPTVVCTTIDQLGSRLLFRGYGVSPNAAPVQASLIAYDSLVLLDEAHISRPFLQTLTNVEEHLRPRKDAPDGIGRPIMKVVPMSATPPPGASAESVFRLDDEDRRNAFLNSVLTARKPARLQAEPDIAKAIVELAGKLARQGTPAIGIIVNRVDTARKIYEKLSEDHQEIPAELVIGAMRPLDREAQLKRLAPRIAADRSTEFHSPSFTISTQCLEVGADYDFDILFTECASLDALRQRFGRLNRRGRRPDAKGFILIQNKDVKSEEVIADNKKPDPIYADSLSRTWNWLQAKATRDESEGVEASVKGGKARSGRAMIADAEFPFGNDAFVQLLPEEDGQRKVPLALLAPSASLDAPVLFPAYLDLLCQTSPAPALEPSLDLFLHGQKSDAEVRVCWRADLPAVDPKSWPEIVALLPPSSAECMSVSIGRLKRWLEDDPARRPISDESDQIGVPPPSFGEAEEGSPRPSTRKKPRFSGLLWRGTNRSSVLDWIDQIYPGDTLVLPVYAGGWNDLGHVPGHGELGVDADTSSARLLRSAGEGTNEEQPPPNRAMDIAEEAYRKSRGRAVLRLHPSLLDEDEGKTLASYFKDLEDEGSPIEKLDLDDLIDHLKEDGSEKVQSLIARLETFKPRHGGYGCDPYPGDKGIVLTWKARAAARDHDLLPPADDGDDSWSRCRSASFVTLGDHTDHVMQRLAETHELIPTCIPAEDLLAAAERHDWGKADDRFQAMLRRADRTEPWLWGRTVLELIAKSNDLPRTPAQRLAARQRANLPEGFRHEMLSLQLSELDSRLEDREHRDLILHLIAAHHGHGRPFAPVVADEETPAIELHGVTLSSDLRQQSPPHHAGSGVAERFWALTRRHGWWGLAYLESLIRLADQQASAAEDDVRTNSKVRPSAQEAVR